MILKFYGGPFFIRRRKDESFIRSPFIEENAFPLIDEPTNHLDLAGRQQVAEYLKKKKHGFILVSHDRAFVDEVVDHILAIEKSIDTVPRDFSIYEEQKIKRCFELAEMKNQKEVNRLKETARKSGMVDEP